MTPTPPDDEVEKIMMFGFESQDFVNDLIGKARLQTALAALNALVERGKLEALRAELLQVHREHVKNDIAGQAKWYVEDRLVEVEKQLAAMSGEGDKK